jgi:hypothetical protein
MTVESFNNSITLLVNQVQQQPTVQEANNALVAEWATWARMNPTLYNENEQRTAHIKESTGTEGKYRSEQMKNVDLLFKILAAHPAPNVQRLADWVTHPETGQQCRRMVVLLHGAKTISKKEMVNHIMTIFAVNLVMVSKNAGECVVDQSKLSAKELADLQYAPSSIQLKYKHIFAWFKQQSVNYEQREFKNHVGSYHAAIKEKFAATLVERPDYGIRKQAPVDRNAQEKIRTNANLHPFKMSMDDKGVHSGYDDCIEILVHEIGHSFGPRGKKEPHSLRLSNFHYFVEDNHPDHKGKRTIQLSGFNGVDKTAKLRLTNVFRGRAQISA